MLIPIIINITVTGKKNKKTINLHLNDIYTSKKKRMNLKEYLLESNDYNKCVYCFAVKEYIQ